MPMYTWKDTRTGVETEVVRSFDEWERPPERDEVLTLSDSQFEKAEWERVIGAPGVVKGARWGGGKGHW